MSRTIEEQVAKLLYDDEDVIALYNEQNTGTTGPNIVQCAILVALVRLGNKRAAPTRPT
jgi:hypothetical protein